MDDLHVTAMLDLCDRFFAAVTRGDIEAVREMYAPDAIIWHNNDGSTQSAEENLRVLAVATRVVTGFRYENVIRHATDDGFLQQHVLRGRAPNGEELYVSACIVCRVAGGRIARLDEYFDSAQIAPLLAGR